MRWVSAFVLGWPWKTPLQRDRSPLGKPKVLRQGTAQLLCQLQASDASLVLVIFRTYRSLAQLRHPKHVTKQVATG